MLLMEEAPLQPKIQYKQYLSTAPAHVWQLHSRSTCDRGLVCVMH